MASVFGVPLIMLRKKGYRKRLSPKNADGFIRVTMEYEDGFNRLPERVTYGMIQAYVEGRESVWVVYT